MRPPRLLIAGGGTGGHLFPGVALAQELQARHPEAKVLFVGTERGIESRVLPTLGWELACIEVSGLKTMGLVGAGRGALRIPGALLQSRKILRSFKPDVVIGVGGYASGPVVLAASLRGLPTAILEQNSIPGLTNRILGKVARRVFLSFSHSQSYFASRKIALVGNPIRREILAALQTGPMASDTTTRLFIVGGSQGATAVNSLCTEAASILKQEGIALKIVHQTGKADLDSTQSRYAEASIDADCRAFIGDMAAEYRVADFIVSRAGATTIAELGVVGRPAILIPYPFAANNHQELNAKEMVAAGAAIMLRQSDTDASGLANVMARLIRDDSERQAMAQAMSSFGRPNAASEVIDWVDQQQC